jgi:hypothetical protein
MSFSFIGFLLVYFYSIGLKPDKFEVIGDTSGESIGIGRIEELRLPVGARKLEDVKSFTINTPVFIEFGQIYINNYIVANSENKDRVLEGDFGAMDEALVFAKNFVRKRNNEIQQPKEVGLFLRRGYNYLVYDLESNGGACISDLDIQVNDVHLETFRRRFPDNLYLPDDDVSSMELQKRLKDAVIVPYGVLCSRRVWEFWLD